MFTIIIRSIIIYIVVLFLFRFMGKRQIGQMQPFELVLTLIIADLATIPMSDVTIPVLHGVVPLLTLVVAHFILTFITRKSILFGKFVNGKPVIVINPNGIDFEALQSLNLTIDDLFEAIRGCNYFNLEQISYAIMETTGKISVVPKMEFAPVTCGDLDIKLEKTTIPITIICDGKYLDDNAKLANVSKSFIDEILKKEKISKIKEVLILTIDGDGKAYFQAKGKNSKVFNVKLPKGTGVWRKF